MRDKIEKEKQRYREIERQRVAERVTESGRKSEKDKERVSENRGEI